MKFRITFETVTEESAQHGDFATHGFVTRNLNIPERTYMPKKPAEFGLREAIEFCQGHGGHCEADSCPISINNPPRWFSWCNEDLNGSCGATGNCTLSRTVSLHLPRNITASSAMRIARYVGCYGIKG